MMGKDEYRTESGIPNRPPQPLTDISGIELKACAPHSMRLMRRACALMAERARRIDRTSRGELAPFVIHSSEGERQRLKSCLNCPDAEPAEIASICRTPNCNGIARADGYCNRCHYKSTAERGAKMDKKKAHKVCKGCGGNQGRFYRGLCAECRKKDTGVSGVSKPLKKKKSCPFCGDQPLDEQFVDRLIERISDRVKNCGVTLELKMRGGE